MHLIHQSAHIQIERLQAFIDGITLAAEQVQDTRLELLEEGPEVDTVSAWADVLLVFVLESTIPGMILTTVAKKMIRPMLKTRTALSYLPKRSDFKDLKLYIKQMKTTYGSQKAGQYLKTKLDGKQYNLYASGIRALAEMSPNAQLNFTALAKAGREAYYKDFKQLSPLDATDTPGVSILNAALTFASINRNAIFYHHSLLEGIVRLGFMTGEDANQFIKIVEWEALDEGLKSIRDRFKLLFEAVIWARLCGFSKTTRKLVVKTYRGTVFEGVDNRLVDYWLKRFGKQIEEWVKSLSGPQLASKGLLPMRGNFKEESFLQQRSYLQNYFIAIVDELPTMPDILEDPFVVKNPLIKFTF
ncbi:hypothetical protein [Candidatus Methanoperedens nitratireducens]|uniref:Uncharacterized protein n=1 Tax=Candidatus Methanoperedens nitratireducens TaxID=1392998 RepID=A0A284VT64_9EURY|nr:hypothetical protein [Candidatus Methanoperedens nitroreducens]SNQ62462.1 hypothetical protein MNV_740013 [Candidatus Methanoperedens nitroreducens]